MLFSHITSDENSTNHSIIQSSTYLQISKQKEKFEQLQKDKNKPTLHCNSATII
jgi:hypothetical protein